MSHVQIIVKGIVQGVGFRPFIYNLAKSLNLRGYVKNTSDGVIIEAEGESLNEFLQSIQDKCPPLARIHSINIVELPSVGYEDFKIIKSFDNGSFTLLSPDISICDDCLRELFDPSDRRYLYPFINCTNCGPRYSITKSVPYDRPNTTMSVFDMCPQCLSEYNNPQNRRFHAQPNACYNCGPKLEFRVESAEFTPLSPPLLTGKLKGGAVQAKEAIKAAIDILKQGGIIAIKGLGGFHLCCDAANKDAVKRLRENKRRSNKPFALMSPTIEMIRQFCEVSKDEEDLLIDRRRPIVLLRKNSEVGPACAVGTADRSHESGLKKLPDEIALNNKYLGFMLPYTPLHYLLFYCSLNLNPELQTPHFESLVMTSGNLSEEPTVISNEEAILKLSGIADAFLLHDRDIFMRVDDSVVRVKGQTSEPRTLNSGLFFIRRARGYVPEPIQFNDECPDVIACGADIKNTFTITKGSYAIVSQHIGDMENLETINFFEETLNNLKQVYRADPAAIAYDLHPNYFSTQWAMLQSQISSLKSQIQHFGIQHHYAHIASVMAERGIKEKVIGVAFDGAGYGTDKNMWGSEFLVCDLNDFKRIAHFKYIPLPGSSQAIRECWRTAISYLMKCGIRNSEFWSIIDSIGFVDKYGRNNIDNILKLINNRQFSPLSSGAGRLFDAVSALLGICDKNTFEGEAAMALENMVHGLQFTVHNEIYPFEILQGDPMIVDFSNMILNIIEDVKNRVDKSLIAARFHNTIINTITEVIISINKKYGIKKVALSGGVFQNSNILENTFIRLLSEGFEVYSNEKVPCNDAGISLGQAYIARERMKNKSLHFCNNLDKLKQ